jgi:sulfur carrier protein
VELTVNGARRRLADSSTVADLMTSAGATGRGSAIAVDGVVVPRSEWQTRRLEPGVRVELVHAVQGG